MKSFIFGPRQRTQQVLCLTILFMVTLLLVCTTPIVSADVHATTSSTRADGTTVLSARVRNEAIGRYEAKFQLYVPESGTDFFTAGTSRTFEPSVVGCELFTQNTPTVVLAVPTAIVYGADFGIKTISFTCSGTARDTSDHVITALVKTPYNFPFKVTVSQNLDDATPIVESTYGFSESGFNPSLVRATGTNAYTVYINNMYTFASQPKLGQMVAFQIQYNSVNNGIISVMPTSGKAAIDGTSALVDITFAPLSADTFGIVSLPAGTRAISFTFTRTGAFPTGLEKIDFNWSLVDPTIAALPADPVTPTSAVRLSPLMYSIPVSALPLATVEQAHLRLNSITVPTSPEFFKDQLAGLPEIKFTFTVQPWSSNKPYAVSLRPSLPFRAGLFFVGCNFAAVANLNNPVYFFGGSEANPRVEFEIGSAAVPTATLTCTATASTAFLTTMASQNQIYKNSIFNVEMSLYETGVGTVTSYIVPYEFAARIGPSPPTIPTLPTPGSGSTTITSVVSATPWRYGPNAEALFEWEVKVTQTGVVFPSVPNQKLESLTDMFTNIVWISTTASVLSSDGSTLAPTTVTASLVEQTNISKTFSFPGAGIFVDPITIYRAVKAGVTMPQKVGDKFEFALGSDITKPVPSTVPVNTLTQLDVSILSTPQEKKSLQLTSPILPYVQFVSPLIENYFIPKTGDEVLSLVDKVLLHPHAFNYPTDLSSHSSNSIWNVFSQTVIYPGTVLDYRATMTNKATTSAHKFDTALFKQNNPLWTSSGTSVGMTLTYNGQTPLVLTEPIEIPYTWALKRSSLSSETATATASWGIKLPREDKVVNSTLVHKINFSAADPVNDSLVSFQFVNPTDTTLLTSIPRLRDNGDKQLTTMPIISTASSLQVIWNPRGGNPLDHLEFELYQYPMAGSGTDPVLLKNGFTNPTGDNKISLYKIMGLDAPSYKNVFFRLKYVYPDPTTNPTVTLDTVSFTLFNGCTVPASTNDVDVNNIDSYAKKCSAVQECVSHIGECLETNGLCSQCFSEGTIGCGSTPDQQCICKEGYSGIACTLNKCKGKNKCNANGGYANTLAGDKCDDKCTCFPNWTGDICDTCSLTCANDGKPFTSCSTCGCTAGFGGNKCQCLAITASITLSASNGLLTATNGKFSFAPESAGAWEMNQEALSNSPYGTNADEADVELYEMYREIFAGLRTAVIPGGDEGKYTLSMTPVADGTTVFKFNINFNCPEANPEFTALEDFQPSFDNLTIGFNDQAVIRKYFGTSDETSAPVPTVPVSPSPETLPGEVKPNSAHGIFAGAIVAVIVALVTIF